MALSAAQIGISIGKNILEGKNIRIDEDGFENFDDYFTETDTNDSDIEIVDIAEDIKIIPVKPPAEDGAKSSVSPLSLSNFPSKKRLSFPVESMSDSDSDSSEEVSYVKSVLSKRGMKSLANANTTVSEDSDHQELIVSKKDVSTAVSASDSNNKMRILSKRGMKSFPEDEESIVEKVASSQRPLLKPVKKCSPENVCDLAAIDPEITANNGDNTSPSSSKECQEKENSLENDNENNENVLSKDISAGKRKRMTISESVRSERNADSSKKIVSAFGVHKPTVQTHYFDVLEINLSLIEEIEKPSRKSMKAVKKPEGSGRPAEKKEVNPECVSVTSTNNLKGTLDSEHKGVPSGVPKDKSSPLRHKKPKPLPTAKQALKSKSLPSEEPKDKSSSLRHKKSQPSPTAKRTLKSNNLPKDKSPPLRCKKPQPSPIAKNTLKSKSVPKDKSSPPLHKKPQPSPTAKQRLKSKSESEDKSSPLRHKKPQPPPTEKPTLKSKSESEDKSSSLRHKKPQPPPTEKPTLKSKSESEDKSSPLRHKKPQPPPTEKPTLKSKSESEDKSSSLRHKKPQPPPTEKPTLKSKSESEDTSSPLRHKKPQPPPTEKPTLKSKSESEDKSSPLRHRKPQPPPTEKPTLKRKSVPKKKPSPLRHKKKPSPLRHKKPQPSLIAKPTLKSKNIPENKSSSLRQKRHHPSPAEKDTLKSMSAVNNRVPSPRTKMYSSSPQAVNGYHINGGECSPRKPSTESPVAAVEPDNKSYPNTSDSFAPKHTYRYINNNMLDPSNKHDIIYCCCLDSEKAFMGMISLKKGAYKQLNRSRNQVTWLTSVVVHSDKRSTTTLANHVWKLKDSGTDYNINWRILDKAKLLVRMFLVQYGKIKVRIGFKNMILTTGDSFMVPANEIYSLRNKSNHDCGLIVTILK